MVVIRVCFPSRTNLPLKVIHHAYVKVLCQFLSSLSPYHLFTYTYTSTFCWIWPFFPEVTFIASYYMFMSIRLHNRPHWNDCVVLTTVTLKIQYNVIWMMTDALFLLVISIIPTNLGWAVLVINKNFNSPLTKKGPTRLLWCLSSNHVMIIEQQKEWKKENTSSRITTTLISSNK